MGRRIKIRGSEKPRSVPEGNKKKLHWRESQSGCEIQGFLNCAVLCCDELRFIKKQNENGLKRNAILHHN